MSATAAITPLPRPEWLPQSVWPFDSVSVAARDGAIAVTDVGRGPTLLLVHTGTWSFIWRDVMNRLASSFRCVAFDAPGTGRSVTRGRPSLEAAARAMNDVIDALRLEDITLVVHDLGGPSALAAATKRPELIRGLVAVNTFAWRPDHKALRFMLAVVGSTPFRELDAATGFLPRIITRRFGIGLHMDQASLRAYVAGFTAQGRRAFHHYMQDARRADDLYTRVEGALTGAFVGLPVITIFGERNDPFGFQPKWKALFPDAPQVVIPKGNHFPMCDDPDLVAKSIRCWHRAHVTTSART